MGLRHPRLCHGIPAASPSATPRCPMHLRSGDLKMMRLAATARQRLVSRRCAADQPSEPSNPSPEEHEDEEDYRDPEDLIEREILDGFRKMCEDELSACDGGSSKDIMVMLLEATLFCEEIEKIERYRKKIALNKCILYRKCRMVTHEICLRVATAARLAAKIAAISRLRVDKTSNEISFHTVDQILGTYVSTFLGFVRDVWHRKVENRAGALLLFGALNGLASVSLILFEDALAAVNIDKQSSSIYNPKWDVETLNYELQNKMKDLEMKFMEAPQLYVDAQALLPILSEATDHVSQFAVQMIRLRDEALAHARARPSDDTEHDGSTS